MEMTFKQYIDNPLGKNNAVFSQRQLFKDLYTAKYNAVLLREAGKIDYTLLYDKKKDEYYCHIKIPSEVVKEFYYDVVIKFYSDDNANVTAPSLNGYKIQVFSNDPAFVFTYLRVFLKNNMFIMDLKDKAPKLALKKDPVEKNPHELVGYVKSLYFAYLFMSQKNLFYKHFYKTNAIPYSKKALLDNVEHADKKIQKRQEEAQKQSRRDRREKLNATRSVDKIVRPTSKTVSSTKNIAHVGTTPRVGKRVSNIHTIKPSISKIKTTKKI